MIAHLKDERKFIVANVEPGIYYISGDIIPIQFIVQRELSVQQNLWLRSLTDKLESQEDTEKLVEAYKQKNKNRLYESVMDIVVRANRDKFREESNMCEALREIMMDIYGEQLEKEVKVEVEKKVKEEVEKSKSSSEKRFNSLMIKLAELGRTDDLIKGAKNPEYQKKLFEEFGL